MTDDPAPARPPRGRHARPASPIGGRGPEAWLRRFDAMGEDARRRFFLAGAGVATAVLLGTLATAGLAAGGGDRPAREAARSGAAAPPLVEQRAAAVGPDDVPDALAFLRAQDAGGATVRHVTAVRRSGDFLRVYTDLGEGDENSRPAVALCEWTVRYLAGDGDAAPRVFVHGRSGDNGSVVLANKQGAGDDCKVDETR
ncbi:hypothetical protein [Actinomadura parmotrematis]|uniref:Uncharacterized protein n=1 Tax=Actinomadura parmotrematis TaxID=2864039 RepID=A0ABS7FQW8_9ACTN|nr:hypothetical protein [Actinomadura parmotrematis]MBW8482370.1 hypothetical protein [Actinomadura parmotrematis]